jgi:hypothetical protein
MGHTKISCSPSARVLVFWTTGKKGKWTSSSSYTVRTFLNSDSQHSPWNTRVCSSSRQLLKFVLLEFVCLHVPILNFVLSTVFALLKLNIISYTVIKHEAEPRRSFNATAWVYVFKPFSKTRCHWINRFYLFFFFAFISNHKTSIQRVLWANALAQNGGGLGGVQWRFLSLSRQVAIFVVSAYCAAGIIVVSMSGLGFEARVKRWAAIRSWKTVRTCGMRRSEWRVWLETYHGALVMFVRSLDW